jgi:predicted amidohydrolase YtcJ
MLIQRAVLLDGTATDVRVDELIVGVGELAPHKGEQVLDAAGGTVIPGLHDHHVHLRSAAAAMTWPARSPTQRSAATAGSGPSATTRRSRDRWTAMCSTRCRRRYRSAYSTAAACCGH